MDVGFLRRWWPVVAIAVLLGLAAAAAAHSSIGIRRIPPPADTIPYVPDYPTAGPTPSVELRPSGAAQAAPAHIPGWIGTAALVLFGLVIIAGVGLVGWTLIGGAGRRATRALPNQVARPATGRTTDDVVAALDAGLVELDDRDTDPRTAVIACWVRLEEAAANAGVPRHAGDTPTDLVTRLLRSDPPAGVPAIVSADVLAAFAGVYREARYATHPVDERMRSQARSALQRLRAELTAPVRIPVLSDGETP